MRDVFQRVSHRFGLAVVWQMLFFHFFLLLLAAVLLQYSFVFCTIATNDLIDDTVQWSVDPFSIAYNSQWDVCCELNFKRRIHTVRYHFTLFNHPFCAFIYCRFCVIYGSTHIIARQLFANLKRGKLKENWGKKMTLNIPHFFMLPISIDCFSNMEVALSGKFFFLSLWLTTDLTKYQKNVFFLIARRTMDKMKSIQET